MRRPGSLLCCLMVLGLALSAAAQDRMSSQTAVGGEIELAAKIHRDWKIRLPAEAVKEIGTGIHFKDSQGADFAAGLDGLTLQLDADGDGELETKVKGEAGFVVLTSGTHRYGIRVMAQPKWVFAPGSAMTGSIEGTRIQLVDQNLNGRFDDFGADAMVVGAGNSAAFLSKIIDLGAGRLVELDISADGTRLSWKEYSGPRGTLDLGLTTSGKVLSCVLKSEDGKISVASAGAEAALVLPAGSYRLHSGLISLGGNRVNVSTGRSKSVAIADGGEAVLALGGPIAAEFAYEEKGAQLEFSPEAIWFYGRAGEEYSGWEPLGKSPRISIVEGKTGREIAEAYFPGSC